jgi:hypothetical protein
VVDTEQRNWVASKGLFMEQELRSRYFRRLLTLLNQALHPNAARVFGNWIVSKEVLEIYSRASGYAMLRCRGL